MRFDRLIATFAIAAISQMPLPAMGFDCPEAFECRRQIDEARAAIDKTWEQMDEVKGIISQSEMIRLHTLLEDAEALLRTALDGLRRSHLGGASAHDHALVIAQANAARGYALAADLLQQHFRAQHED